MSKQTIVFGILIGAIACLTIAQPNATQTKATNNFKAENGRWQIVNGTPDMARNIMLLDTQTGDSWITCNATGGVTTWCLISRTNLNTGNPSPASLVCLHYDASGACTGGYGPPKPPEQ